MKRFWSGLLILALSAAMSAQTTTAAPKAKKKAKAATTTTADEIRELKEMMQQQQAQIQALQQQIQERDATVQQLQQQVQQTQSAAQQAQQQASQAESSSAQKDDVEKLKSDMKDVQSTLTNTAVQTQDEQKHVAGIEGVVNRFQWGGDVRVRYENFSNQDNAGCVGLGVGHCEDRQRARIRVRFGVTGKLNEDFIAGLRVATGAQTDPTTTNETLTNAFERKNFFLDQGYVTYNPVAHKWLSLTGGKWAYTFARTSMTFDPDINPEGFDEKVSFDFHNSFFKNFNAQLFQLMFNEVSKGADDWASGGQIGAKLQLGSRWTMVPTYSLLNWYGENSLAQTAFQGSTVPFAPNGFTNSAYTGLGCGAGKLCYSSGFLYSDFIWNNTFKTWSDRFPLYVIGQFEQNLDAKKANFDKSFGSSPVPVGTLQCASFSGTTAAPGALIYVNCASPQDKGYAIEVGMGQQKNQGDWQFGYEWRREEADAALAAFSESDQRAPTNVLQHRFYVNYKVRKNTQLMFTDWIGRTLNPFLQNAVHAEGTTTPGIVREPYLNRLQMDVVYTF